jgi:RimJ/RimL family protein N-acetyltransferase
MGPKPILLAGRLVRLEPLAPSHAPGLFEALAADPAVWRWLVVPPPETPALLEAQIAGDLEAQARGELVPLTQVEQATGRPVGRTNYMNISRGDRGLEIGGTWLGRPWHRTGLNTEAKYLLLRHAFEELGAVRVQLKTDGRNLQSQAAIARLGAVREGTLRKHMRVYDGFIRDTVMFSVIDSEWPAVKARLEGLLAAHPRPGEG